MAVDLKKLEEFAKLNPTVIRSGLDIVTREVDQDATVLTDLLGAIGGSFKPLAFVVAHPKMVGDIFAAAAPLLGSHPDLLGQLLGMFGAD